MHGGEGRPQERQGEQERAAEEGGQCLAVGLNLGRTAGIHTMLIAQWPKDDDVIGGAVACCCCSFPFSRCRRPSVPLFCQA